MIFGNFGGRKANLEDFGDLSDLGNDSRAKGSPQNEVILHPETDFLSLVFLIILLCCVFLDFCDFGCPDTPFWFQF